MTIPAGTFGNDRDIKVEGDRWYSKSLQILVKTANSDPRFGVITYELSQIRRDARTPHCSNCPAATLL